MLALYTNKADSKFLALPETFGDKVNDIWCAFIRKVLAARLGSCDTMLIMYPSHHFFRSVYLFIFHLCSQESILRGNCPTKYPAKIGAVRV